MSRDPERSEVDRVVDDLVLAGGMLPAGPQPEPQHDRPDDHVEQGGAR